MITDIPTQTDYENTALRLLNLAWENTVTLVVNLDYAKNYDKHNSFPEKDYWDACQSQLSTAVSLVQQAFEFFLKAKIITVSPYLLISGTSRDWPKGCDKRDIPFAEFYTIDAQDLIRTHNTVSTTVLSPDMKELFESMRKIRNSIMHTVDKRLKLEVKQVVCAILEISAWFVGPCKWIETRREHLRKSPNSIAYEYEWSDSETCFLAMEITKVVDILKPVEVSRFFGFNKKHRRYICPLCSRNCSDADLQPNLAFLVPNTSTSTNLHCYLCSQDFSIIRKQCTKKGCKGNVLADEKYDEKCLTCYSTL